MSKAISSTKVHFKTTRSDSVLTNKCYAQIDLVSLKSADDGNILATYQFKTYSEFDKEYSEASYGVDLFASFRGIIGANTSKLISVSRTDGMDELSGKAYGAINITSGFHLVSSDTVTVLCGKDINGILVNVYGSMDAVVPDERPARVVIDQSDTYYVSYEQVAAEASRNDIPFGSPSGFKVYDTVPYSIIYKSTDTGQIARIEALPERDTVPEMLDVVVSADGAIPDRDHRWSIVRITPPVSVFAEYGNANILFAITDGDVVLKQWDSGCTAMDTYCTVDANASRDESNRSTVHLSVSGESASISTSRTLDILARNTPDSEYTKIGSLPSPGTVKFENITGDITLDTEYSWDIVVEINDGLRTSRSAVQRIYSTDSIMDIRTDGTGAAFGGNADNDDEFDIHWLNTKIYNLRVDGEIESEGIVREDNIADEAVNEYKLQNDSVSTDKLQNEAVTTEKLEDGAITNRKLDDDSITTDKLVDASVTEDKLANKSVTAEKIDTDDLFSQDIKVKDSGVIEGWHIRTAPSPGAQVPGETDTVYFTNAEIGGETNTDDSGSAYVPGVVFNYGTWDRTTLEYDDPELGHVVEKHDPEVYGAVGLEAGSPDSESEDPFPHLFVHSLSGYSGGGSVKRPLMYESDILSLISRYMTWQYKGSRKGSGNSNIVQISPEEGETITELYVSVAVADRVYLPLYVPIPAATGSEATYRFATGWPSTNNGYAAIGVQVLNDGRVNVVLSNAYSGTTNVTTTATWFVYYRRAKKLT